MNTPVPSNFLSDALRNVAMIGELSSSALGLSRTDKTASKKANADAGATADPGRVVVQRFAGADELPRKIQGLQVEAFDNLKGMSTAWGNGKRRLLPNANFQGWIAAHTRIKDEHDKAVQEFVDNADDIIARAKANLGTYDVDLPTKEEIAAAYSLEYTLEPIPDGNHFKGGEDIEAHLRHQFEQNMQAAYTDATQDALKRLADPLSKLAERLEAYDARERDIANGKDPGKFGIFRDTLVENLQDMTRVFASFNVLGDPSMDAIAKKIEAFGKIDADVLRKRGDIRAAATARAKEVMKDLDDLLAR